MAKEKSKQKQDTPEEMIKRVFAVAELVAQTDRYQDIRLSAEKTPQKTQNHESSVL